MVFQIQLMHERDAVPLTRDYITDYDRQERSLNPSRPQSPVIARADRERVPG